MYVCMYVCMNAFTGQMGKNFIVNLLKGKSDAEKRKKEKCDWTESVRCLSRCCQGSLCFCAHQCAGISRLSLFFCAHQCVGISVLGQKGDSLRRLHYSYSLHAVKLRMKTWISTKSYATCMHTYTHTHIHTYIHTIHTYINTQPNVRVGAGLYFNLGI